MRTLFCFSLELNQLADKDREALPTKELVEVCKTNFKNLWVILF